MTNYASNRRQAYNAYVSPFPFEPRAGVSLSCSTSSARAALGTGDQALITNQGTVYAFVVFGDSTVVAITSRLAVPPESQVLVTIPEGSTHIAGITSSSSATLQIETGFGV